MKTPSLLFIPGQQGQLETMLTEPVESLQKVVCIICHPNPTQEGTMHNKVVTTMARAFDHMGFITVRFNYRGVGKSEGTYGKVLGEIDDLKSILDWVKQQWPEHKVWLAGFSFGSYISSSVANEREGIDQLVSVAPAVNHHDFNALTEIHCPWLVIASDSDEVVPFDQVKPWLESPPSPIETVILHGASHFFHGRLIELRDILVERLNR